MTNHDRELMKHEIQDELAYRQNEPPPFAEAPDAAETLRLLDRVSRLPAIRFDKVQRMRELIARDELETEERIDGTAGRLAEELGL
jgi:hypothetical protein